MKGFKTLIGILNNSNIPPPFLCISLFREYKETAFAQPRVTWPSYILINSNAITYADNILEWSNIILAKINQKYSK